MLFNKRVIGSPLLWGLFLKKNMQCLPEEAGDPGGVDAGEAGGGLDGGVAADDAGAVFIDVEADAETVHLAVFRV